MISNFDITQRALNDFNKWRLRPALPPELPARTDEDAPHALELDFLEAERAGVAARAAEAPTDAAGFLAWYTALEQNGPGQHDALFEWLAHEASREQMTWFLRQEIAGEAGFDDLVALTQVKMPTRVKLELARNYWDEMGQGTAEAMHGPMLGSLGQALGIVDTPSTQIVAESLALGNLLLGLAMHRSYAYQSIGALGIIELTAPGRAERVNAGLKRLGIGGEARRYFALHATLDVKHSAAWNREVIHPLVSADPRLARPIAEGAPMRLTAGARCFARYKRELGLRL